MIPLSSRLIFPLVVSTCLMPLTTALSAEPYTPKPGSAEREALMNALREPVKAELKREVIFKVSRLKVLGQWAFLAGEPLKSDGSPMDYTGTIHEEALREGAFDGGIFALLHLTHGQWVTVRYVIGATDVPYVDWPEETGAPKAIFE